jgi:hypothetical protein
MKKILITVAALGLGLTLAASVASAATFSAKGKYQATGIWVSDGAAGANGLVVGLDGNVPSEANDAIWHSAYFYPTVNVNDSIVVRSELRFIDRDFFGTTKGASNENMRVFKLWMEYDSPIGKWAVGRQPAGTWGTKFLDSTANGDRISWVPNMIPAPFSAKFIFQKNTELDAFTGTSDESDAASWYAGVGHKGDIGSTTVALWHTRNDGVNGVGDYNNTHFWFTGTYNLGGVGISSEARYVFGDDSSMNDLGSLAAMVTASMGFDNLTAGVITFYCQGDDTVDGDNEGAACAGGTGNDYNPFLVATGDYFGLLNGDKGGYLAAAGAAGVTGNGDQPGAIAAALFAVMQASDKMSFNAAIGHVWVDADFGMDDDMGLEVDLGMTYKLMDNLAYTAQFGFLKPGGFVEDMVVGGNTNDIYVLLHSLTMTF